MNVTIEWLERRLSDGSFDNAKGQSRRDFCEREVVRWKVAGDSLGRHALGVGRG